MTEKAANADVELKKGFAELQSKLQETNQQMRVADAQIEGLRREKAHAELTKMEVAGLNGKTPTYEAIGRLFIRRDMETVLKHLHQRVEKADDKMKALENSKSILERNMKESENNMRELVTQWKSK